MAGSNGAIDDVLVTDAADSVPEPATFALLAVAALAAAIRRMR
ncbi:MAG: PEP-CTERM sorting domain-containing protein [Acidobacteria bacterium]|nr:PEP-CTERM sorting domain-containing protein [Acidobacteriota bacterium]